VTSRLRRAASVLALALAAGSSGCGETTKGPVDPLSVARTRAEGSRDGEVVGRWLLAELVEPGGTPVQANAARKALDALTPRAKGMVASLARAVDDEAHGRFVAAAAELTDAVDAARSFEGPEASLFGWYAAHDLVRLRSSVPHLWDSSKAVVEAAIERPGRIGFRARGELIDFWLADGAPTSPETKTTAPIDLASRKLGCVEHARLAGPFGHLSPADSGKSFEAERPGPWPVTFTRDPKRIDPPRIIKSKVRGCQISATEPADAGVYYVETFIDLPAERHVILAVQGAWSMSVDDVEVLARDPDTWASWPRFGVHLHLEGGRHRVLARLGGPDTSIRVLDEEGRPLAVTSSDDPSAPYSLRPPQLLADPNPLDPFLTALGVGAAPRRGAVDGSVQQVDTSDPALRFVAAELAHVDGQDDLAGVLLEPLVKEPAKATGIALSEAASYLEGDPIFTPNDARDLALDLRTKAADKDALLWHPRLWLLLDSADKQGMNEVMPKLVDLAEQFDQVPGILKGLASAYARLGWKAEHERAVSEAARRFPDDPEVLRAQLGIADQAGRFDEADRIVARLRTLEPGSQIEVERAIARGDFQGAIELLKKVRDDRRDPKAVAARVLDLLTRAGRSAETFEALDKALRDDPKNDKAMLAIADARLASGDKSALRRALVDAIRKGVETDQIRSAMELVEGLSELSAYRVDGLAMIREYEKSGAAERGLERAASRDADADPKSPKPADRRPAGNAARVLDYSAMWIRADGTARMLEHEIIHLQSHEAIAEHAEQQLPRGTLLRIRTIKRDGTILEPEIVSGKPTVTMPHLDVGDYIETETIYSLGGDGQGGRSFLGPRWFFREEKIDYYRSEFVIVSPKDKKLDVETTGDVPAPQITEDGALVTRRYRVDKNLALPEEPFRAPVEEFLPSVRIGWGINQADTLERFLDLASTKTPADPRLVRIATTIVESSGAAGSSHELAKISKDDRARRIYRWVLANVEAGRENDPRRAVTGKSGSRLEAFLYLSRLVGVNIERALVQDRLAPPPRGPMSESELFASLAVAVPLEGPKPRSHGGLRTTLGDEGGDAAKYRFMLVGDKYAPYGFMPSALRGQPAVLLVQGLPRVTTPSDGSSDRVDATGTVTLAADGSAKLSLDQAYSGRLAIGLRNALETLPDARLKDAIESQLLPQSLPGARLDAVDVKHLDDLDSPVSLAMKIEVSTFAKPSREGLVVAPPFSPSIGDVASLPARQTPLFIAEQNALSRHVRLVVDLPKGAKVKSSLDKLEGKDGPRSFVVTDHLEGDKLVIERSIEIPAGRVQPSAYAAFAAFARAADQAFDREIVIDLP
jgi:tetratricopeptide (TPR) repeat protein